MSMSRFLPYNPEQAYLLPPSVQDELGADHLCFFVHAVVERLDLGEFEQVYSAEGGELYHPALMLKLWLYAYALGLTSARRLEQRVKEDLGFRYLAGGAQPDHWTLSAFRRRHGRGINDAFTQVLEWIRDQRGRRLGRVAIDSTRIRANACRDRIDTEQRLRQERAQLRRQVRRWQKQCDASDGEQGGGMIAPLVELQQRLEELPRRLERLRRSGQAKLSRRDGDARFLRERGGFVLGYTAEVAVSDDHFIVAQRVTHNAQDVHALVPMVDAAQRQCGSPPAQVVADAGFFSLENVTELARRGIDAYVPDSNLARELNTGQKCPAHNRPRHPVQQRMRQKLRSPAGRALYARRKAVVEPVLGILKQQRGMRQFRTRGLPKVSIEFTLASLAHNIKHWFSCPSA
jgi:transposase/IS5 family transposase